MNINVIKLLIIISSIFGAIGVLYKMNELSLNQNEDGIFSKNNLNTKNIYLIDGGISYK